ncbi:MAG TPA: BTAD domain-containing putative transcriptional regulator [Gemmatimonadales bacterium]|nr:BTAD domain-containing putative transcriptional regulator [Gemmatimonadales bacterium]
MIQLRLLGSVALTGPAGEEPSGVLRQPKGLALLAYLAVASPRGYHRRDTLLALFWPERDMEHARAALRHWLYTLRRALGEGVILSRGDEEVGLAPDRFWCDAAAFEDAAAAGRPEEASDLYQGDLLAGFHLSDAPEFERWLEEARARFRDRATQAAWSLAGDNDGSARLPVAVRWARRGLALAPYDESGVRRLMALLDRKGDRAQAVREYEQFARRLAVDLELEPSTETVALAEAIRRRQGGARSNNVAALDAVDRRPDPEPKLPRRHGWVPVMLAVLTAVVGVGLAAGAILRDRSPELAPHRVAAAVFENRTGRRDLDPLGTLAADWIIRGLVQTPLVDVTDLEAVYAGGRSDSGRSVDSRSLARRNGAGMVISGSYYRSGDSVLFQAGIADVATGRILRSFEPVGAPVERAPDALKALRDLVVGGLAILVNPAFAPVDPDMSPPKLAAYREFMAGLNRESWRDWKTAAAHYRQAAALDSTFIAPVVQLAFGSLWAGADCRVTDSLAAALDRPRDQLTPWNRMTIDIERFRCRDGQPTAVRLLERRFHAYPQSKAARWQYAWALLHSNQPRAARELLQRLDPDRDCKDESQHCLGWFPGDARSEYWSLVTAADHILGDHRAELAVTDRWRDSTNSRWQLVRGRALGAIGREQEVFELFRSMTLRSVDSVAQPSLAMATELLVHGHRSIGIAVAESILAHLELTPDVDSSRAGYIAWANQLLGRKEAELAALRKMAWSTLSAVHTISEVDTTLMLDAEGRVAVLVGDTTGAERIDSILAEQSRRVLRHPWIRGALIVAQAHIAAGLGRRDQAVALLKAASARGLLELGPSFAYHQDLLLAPLRGYPPFEALLRPDN